MRGHFCRPWAVAGKRQKAVVQVPIVMCAAGPPPGRRHPPNFPPGAAAMAGCGSDSASAHGSPHESRGNGRGDLPSSVALPTLQPGPMPDASFPATSYVGELRCDPCDMCFGVARLRWACSSAAAPASWCCRLSPRAPVRRWPQRRRWRRMSPCTTTHRATAADTQRRVPTGVIAVTHVTAASSTCACRVQPVKVPSCAGRGACLVHAVLATVAPPYSTGRRTITRRIPCLHFAP